MMETAVIWAWLMVSTNTVQPDMEPWILPDSYKTQELCEVDRDALQNSTPGRHAWCVPVMKPEAKKKQQRLASRRRIVRR